MERTRQSRRERLLNFKYGYTRQVPIRSMDIIESMVEGEDSTLAKRKAKKYFESLAMILGQSVREYVARAEGLASAVRYHRVDVADGGICCRILTGLLPELSFAREGFAFRIGCSLAEPEQALVNVEELKKLPDG